MLCLGLALALLAGCGRQARPQTGEPIRPAGEAARAGDYQRPLGAAVENEFAQEDTTYRRLLTERFTSVTPENALKWALAEPERGEFDFSEMDAIVHFAERTGKRVRGHPLVWDQQLPDWVDDLSERELAAAFDRHIRAIATRYRGKVAEWDVVNEPLEDDGSLTQSVFMRKLGPGYIARAFRVARAADPDAKLFLNEIGAEPPSAKGNALYNLVKSLKRRDVPIDGVGLQTHRSDEGYPTRQTLVAEFERYRKLGLEVAITEMDVTSDSATGSEGQAFAYHAAAAACAEAPNCTGVTVWGVTDNHSWLGEDKHPLLFGADGRPKQAMAVVERILKR